MSVQDSECAELRESAEAVARIWLVNANVETTPERVESLTRLILGVRKAASR
jgi:hypothetical protein